MRELIDIVAIAEARCFGPSPELVRAIVSWLNGWNKNERNAKELALYALASEARRFTNSRYPRLYRGMEITPEQRDALLHGHHIYINMPTLASWTLDRTIAQDFAESEGDGILLAKSNLVPFLDIAKVASLMPESSDNDGIPDDHLRYAAREGEVICLHTQPLTVSPRDVLKAYFMTDDGSMLDWPTRRQ